MNKKLWEASKQQKNNSNLSKFEKFISNKYNKNFDHNFERIHGWSVKNPHDFWDSVWDYSKIKGTKNKIKSKKSTKFYKQFFKKTRFSCFILNFHKLEIINYDS